MRIVEFLEQYKSNGSENITHTSMKGGKWNIPAKDYKKLYKQILKSNAKNQSIPLTETIQQEHPLIFDIDIKYSKKFTKSQISTNCIKYLLEYIWSYIRTIVDIDDESMYNEVYVMLKDKPYPCSKKNYQSKDGIHLVYPKIIIKRDAYKILCNLIDEKSDGLFTIFSDHCKNPPSNLDNTLLDGKFTRWLPYTCHKEGESPYLLEHVYIMNEGVAHEKNQALIKGDDAFYTEELLICQCSMFREGLKENVSYTDYTENELKSKVSNTCNMVSEGVPDNNDVYAAYYVDNNNIINPYKIVEEEELKYVKGLVSCLSAKRATDYDPWLSVGFCLHNINVSLLDEWKQFSKLTSSYDPISCDKQWLLNGTSTYGGNKYGIGSLVKWSKEDNEKLFDSVKRDSVASCVHNSVVNGTDADYLIAQVIHKYFENEYISMNVKDEWYYFNGVRWERTLEGTHLRMSIHNKVWKIYHEYEPKYVQRKQEAMEKADSDDERKDIQAVKTKEGR